MARDRSAAAIGFVPPHRVLPRRMRAGHLLLLIAALFGSPILTSCMVSYSPQAGSDRVFVDGIELTGQQERDLIQQADASLSAEPTLYEASARCWFDRQPSSVVQVACGPTLVPSPYESQTSIGPPYFNVFQLELDASSPGQPLLTKPAILSMASLPSDLWRPDGATLRP